MSDYIDSLPTDEIPLTHQENAVFHNYIVPEQTTSFIRLFNEFKGVLVVGILFFILNTQTASEFVQNTIPYAKTSPVSLLITKSGIFMAVLFLLKNLAEN